MPPECRFHRRRFLAASTAFAVLMCVGVAQSQENKPPLEGLQKAPKTPELTAKQIDERVEAAKATLKDKPEVLKQVLSLYDQAKTHLDKAAEFRKQLERFRSLQKNVKQLVEEQNRELKKPIADPEADVNSETKLAELEQRLASAQQAEATAQKTLSDLERERKRRATRRTEVPERISAAKKELAAVKAAKPAVGQPPEVQKAQQTVQQSKYIELRAEIAALQAEIPTYDITTTLLNLQIQVAGREVQRTERAVKFWEKLVERRRGSEADQQLAAARELLQRIRDNGLPDGLIELATKNVDLARSRTERDEKRNLDALVKRISDTTAAVKETQDDLKTLKEQRESVDEKLKIPGVEDVIGPLLLEQRRRLPNPRTLERSISKRQRELSDVRYELLRIQEQAERLSNLDEQVKRETASLSGSRDNKGRERLEQWVRAVLTERQKLLESLRGDYENLLKQMADLSAKERQMADAAADFRRLIDRHILWIRSTRPLDLDDFPRAGSALLWALSLEDWRGVARALWRSLVARPIVSALAIFLLALMVLRERALKQRLRDAGLQAAKGFTEPFRLTGQALGLSLLLAAQWAAVLWFLGWQLESYAGSSPFAASVGTALQTVAAALFTLEFLRRMFRPHGLAEAHFRWRDTRLTTIRRHLRWLELAALPLAFLRALIADFANETYETSLGRLLLMGLLVLTSVFLAVVLRKQSAAEATTAQDHVVAERSRTYLQTAAYLCAVSFPLVLALLAGAGYLYTAGLLTTKLLQTIWVAIVLLVLHAMAVRWLYHARGRLALERIRAAQAAKAEAASSVAAAPVKDDTGSEVSVLTVEAQPASDTDMATINVQTKRLLRFVIAGGAFFGVWLIWWDVLPALKFLDYAPSWLTTETVPGPDGEPVPKPAVRDLLAVLAVLVVAIVAARNIPGLLEVAVLQRLPIDSGARYAASTVARYLIYIIGLIPVFTLLGIGMAKVMLFFGTAFSGGLGLGLGFGLQEIIANWVSGIILLFERPLRVGDVVTVGDVTGVVTRIQIRATTIRNWDRKEYVVPNKELVTGKLLNWTLTDPINRVVINVGVAYGTPGDRVRDLLMEIVKAHPNVSETPQPMVTFEEFGDSCLKFVVRCYLPNLDERLKTVHELHCEIQRRFAEADIEIAFPQLDLHIRSDEAHADGVPVAITKGGTSQGNGAGSEIGAESGTTHHSSLTTHD